MRRPPKVGLCRRTTFAGAQRRNLKMLSPKSIWGSFLCIATNRLVVAGTPIPNLPKGLGLRYTPLIDNKPQFLSKIRAMLVICGYNIGL